MEPASRALSPDLYIFNQLPIEIFESVSEYVAGGPLVKKEGFDDSKAERELTAMSRKISDDAVVDLDAFHSVRPGYNSPLTDAIFHSKLSEAVATTNIKRGKAWVHFTTESIDEIRANYRFIYDHRDMSSRIDRVQNKVDDIKVRCGIIQEFIMIQEYYFVATDRGLFIYDSKKDKENPLFSLDVKLDFLHAGSTDYVLVGRCEDGRFLILDFRDKAAPKVNQTLPNVSKIEFIKKIFNNIIFEPAKAALKTISSLPKWKFGLIAIGILSVGLFALGIVLINTVAVPLVALLGWQLALTVFVPLVLGGAAVGFYLGVNPSLAAYSTLRSGIQKSMMQYKCYFS